MFPWLFPDTATQLNRIERKLDRLMAKVQIDQESLDTFASEISDAVTTISDEIAALVASTSNPLTDADVTGLQSAVDALKGLEPPATEPVPAE